MTPASTRLVARAFSDDDYNFVITTWLRSARERSYHAPGSGSWARVLLRRETFYDLNRPVCEHLLDPGSRATVLVVCDSQSEETIAGWAIYRMGRCLWAFTVEELRGNGVWKINLKAATDRGLLTVMPESRPKRRAKAPAKATGE